MARIISWKPRHQRDKAAHALPQELPIVLSRMLAAGAVDFARIALDAWGSGEMAPEEILELCNTYAMIADLKTLA